MSNPVWTYHVVLGDGTQSVMEVGPFPTVTEALTFAAGSMGRDALAVEADVTDRLIDEGPDAAPTADWRLIDEASPYRRLIGYTIERYDGEQTDDSWSLNGGLRSAIREAAAA